MATVQCSANGEWCEYDNDDTHEQIGETLRAQGFLGTVRLFDDAGFRRGWVRVEDDGAIDWSAT